VTGSDPWQDSSTKAWAKHVIDEMVPKMESSALVISLVPESREGDVKFWVELGASIMMDKPIIAVLLGDGPVPKKLELIADEIVRAPHGVDPASSEELAAAISRLIGLGTRGESE
jgi:hypothetical protein